MARSLPGKSREQLRARLPAKSSEGLPARLWARLQVRSRTRWPVISYNFQRSKFAEKCQDKFFVK